MNQFLFSAMNKIMSLLEYKSTRSCPSNYIWKIAVILYITDSQWFISQGPRTLQRFSDLCKNLCPYIKLLKKIVAVVKKRCSVYRRQLVFLQLQLQCARAFNVHVHHRCLMHTRHGLKTWKRVALPIITTRAQSDIQDPFIRYTQFTE